jgi:hypothetical protein
VTLLGQISGTPAEQYQRHQARLMLQAAAERDAAERKARCGRACDLADFEPKLAELVRERIE